MGPWRVLVAEWQWLVVDGWQDSRVAHVWDDSWLELNTAWSWTQYGKITQLCLKMHLLETETNRQLQVWFLRRCYMWCQKQTQTIVRHVICAKDVWKRFVLPNICWYFIWEQKGGQHRRSIDPWLACRTVQCELLVEWLVPPPSPLLCFVSGLWMSFFLVLVAETRTMSKYINLRAGALTAAYHGITNVGDPRLVAKQPTACHHWCCSCPIDTACHCRHEPYGPINCPADIVPSYRWRNCDCHQTFWCLFSLVFSSGMADHALMRRSTLRNFYMDTGGRMQRDKSSKPKHKPPKTNGKTQIPSQICVSPSKDSKANSEQEQKTARLVVSSMNWTIARCTKRWQDHRVQPHGHHAHRFMDTIQKPARCYLVIWQEDLERWKTWCESRANVKRQKLTALRSLSESSHVCFVYHQTWVSSSALAGPSWVSSDRFAQCSSEDVLDSFSGQ